MSEQQNGTLILPEGKNVGAKWVASRAERLMAVLPPEVPRQQFGANLVAAANELTKPCEPMTVLQSAYNAARVGLQVGGQMGLAHFVPFKNGKKSRDRGEDVYDCQLIIGYPGFLDLAFGNEFLVTLHCDVILSGEEWEYYVTQHGPQFRHVPSVDRELGDDTAVKEENITHAYCVWTNRNGGYGVEVVPKRAIDKVKNQRSDAWKYEYPQMAKKTALRRAARWWKKSARLARAMNLEDAIETGTPQPGSDEIDPPESDDSQQVTFDSFSAPEQDDIEDAEHEPAAPKTDEQSLEEEAAADEAARAEEAAGLFNDSK